jgi:hypothetical protein
MPEPSWPGRVAVSLEGREEADVLAEVVVFPLPLVARDLDVQVHVAHVLDLDERARDRHGHEHQDGDGITVQMISTLVLWTRVLSCLRALRLTELDDRVDHHAEHHHGDGHADPQDEHVQAVDLLAQDGDALGHVEPAPIGVRNGCQQGEQGGGGGLQYTARVAILHVKAHR